MGRQRIESQRQEAATRESNMESIEEIRKLQEMRALELQRIERESKSAKGQVTRRADDPYGQGFGFVKTGYVSSQKLSILQRAASVDRRDSKSEIRGESPALSNASLKTKGLRVTWAESPGSSRPGSTLSWTNMDSQGLRAETPPLAAEWAVTKGSDSMETSKSISSDMRATSQNQAIKMSNGVSMSSSSFKTQSLASSFQSSTSSAFSSSNSFKSKSSQASFSSFQSGNIKSQTFEAFPGMGGIENLNLESEKAGN